MVTTMIDHRLFILVGGAVLFPGVYGDTFWQSGAIRRGRAGRKILPRAGAHQAAGDHFCPQ